VAVSAALLAAVGLPPFQAAALCLVANTAPVAFGALATPVVTLAGVTGLPLSALSATIGRLCPLIALIIPMYLLVLLAGWRRALAAWPAAMACGISFAVSQFLVSNYIGPYLTDIISAIAAGAALLVVTRVWQPGVPFRLDGQTAVRPAMAASSVSPASSGRAWAPYAILVLLVLVWGSPWAVPWLDSATLPYPAVYAFSWLASAGTACFLAAVFAAVATGIGLRRFAAVTRRTAHRLWLAELTIAAVLALAYVMNYSGATATLGLTAAGTGVAFPFFSAFLGWLGVFLTGSDTSANALFGNLQMISARALSLDPVLMASVNSAGGVLGKMISIQSIAVAAAATRMPAGSEGRLFLFTLRHSLLLTTLMGIIAMLFAYM
jgi:lactate permease